jgi:hypothetical protein
MIKALQRRLRHHGKRFRTRLDILQAAREAARRNGRGVLELTVEKERLLREYGITDEALSGYGLDVDKMSFYEKTTYLPTEWHAAHRIWQKFVSEHRRTPFHNKYLFNRYFKAEGLPVARIFGFLDSDFGRLRDGRPLQTAEDLGEWMRDRSEAGPPETGFIIKPVEGYKGHALHVLEKRAPGNDESFVTLDGRTFSADDLYTATASNPEVQTLGRQVWTRSFLLEERLRPHEELASLIGPTFCTVRIVTFITREGSPSVLGAALKIMPGRSGVDHTSRGAIGAWIDEETGNLQHGRLQDQAGFIDSVPGTDRGFVGFVIPHWNEVKEVALEAQRTFPWARAIGWDIGITDHGPVIVEGNEWWSMTGLQRSAPHGLFDGRFRAAYESL